MSNRTLSLADVASRLQAWSDTAVASAQRAAGTPAAASYSSLSDSYSLLARSIRAHLGTPATAPRSAGAPRSAAAAPAPKRTAAAPAPKRSKGIGAELFFDAFQAARRAVSADLGERWVMLHGVARWAELPAKLRSFKGPKGGKITLPRDVRVPPAEYWRGGQVPVQLEYAPPTPSTFCQRVTLQDWRTGKLVELHPNEVPGWLCMQDADIDRAKANHRRAVQSARAARLRTPQLRSDREECASYLRFAAKARARIAECKAERVTARRDWWELLVTADLCPTECED